jgi:hypothetical protein
MNRRDLFGRYSPIKPVKRKGKEPLTPRARLLRRRLRRRIKEIELLRFRIEEEIEPWKGSDPPAQPFIEENKEIKLEPLKDQIYFEFVNIDSSRFDDDIEWQLITELILEETAKLEFNKEKSVKPLFDNKELDKEVEEILKNPLPSPIK